MNKAPYDPPSMAGSENTPGRGEGTPENRRQSLVRQRSMARQRIEISGKNEKVRRMLWQIRSTRLLASCVARCVQPPFFRGYVR